MPRDGSFIYAIPPGTEGIPDTTIASAKYNGFAHDVETDLNLPRPIVAGGTGATDAITARANLSVEVRNIEVTNYDSHIFEDGSFWSQTTALASPVPGEQFTGNAVRLNNDPALVRLLVLSWQTGKVYVRKKSAGVWGVWSLASDDTFISVTGDTMTGDLKITKNTPILTLNKTASGQNAGIFGSLNDALRWSVILGNADAESGGNTGSNFAIVRTNDAGVGIDTPLLINRQSALATFGGSVTVTNTLTALSHIVGQSGNIFINAQAGQNSQLWLRDEGSNNKGVLFWDRAANSVKLMNMGGSSYPLVVDGVGKIYPGRGLFGKGGETTTTYDTSVHNFSWTGVLQAWVGDANVGNVTLTCDYRAKQNVVDLPRTWDAVKELRPISYTQATFKPPVMKADEPALYSADSIERWGFIAHELQETLLPTAATGVKDSPDTVQSPNLLPLLAAVTKALQEAQTRIEALEAAVGTTPTATILQRLDVLDKFREKIEAL